MFGRWQRGEISASELANKVEAELDYLDDGLAQLVVSMARALDRGVRQPAGIDWNYVIYWYDDVDGYRHYEHIGCPASLEFRRWSKKWPRPDIAPPAEVECKGCRAALPTRHDAHRPVGS